MRKVDIAGGGLAGLSLAAGLRLRGIPVTVCEAGSYPRHRVCGEFISGVRAEILESLGIAEALADARRLESVTWRRQGKRIFDGMLPVAALGISRHRLDGRLCERVRASGGEVIEGVRSAREAGEGRVWAAGRLPRKSAWLGLKCHVKGLPMTADLEMHLGGNGYVGLAPVEDDRVNVCGLFRIDRGLHAKGSGLLLEYLRSGGNGILADRLEAAQRDEDSFSGAAGFELGWQEETGCCVVGDAAGMIPPFTGNGMSMAFESAELAVGPLAAWSGGTLGWGGVVSMVREQARRRFRRRIIAGMALHRVILNANGRRLIEAVSRAGLLPFRPLLSLVR